MPNYVRNKIDIYGREEEVKRLVELVKGKGNQYFDFEKIIPMPEDIYRGPLGKAEEEKYGEKIGMTGVANTGAPNGTPLAM